MKILIIRFSSIGDIVLTTPVMRCIKMQRPDSEVHYLTKEKFAALLSSNPNIDKIHFLKSDLNNLITELKNEGYDCVIDLQNNFKSMKVKRALRCRRFTVNKVNISKWIMVNFKINTLPDVHVVDRYMATVKELGVKNDYKGLEYFIPEKDQIRPTDLPFTHIYGYVAVAVGGTYSTKRMPVEKLIDLCSALKPPVVLVGGVEDEVTGNKIAEAIGPRCYNACGRYNLNQSASIIKGALKVVTHDTGMMHVAAAFKKETLSIWGNTIPAFGMAPYMPQNPEKSHIFEVKGLNCRPCTKLGFSHCPKKHFKCMQMQDVQSMADIINGI